MRRGRVMAGVVCVNAHDLCYQGGPCPYCEKPKRRPAMSADAYRQALSALDLSQGQAAKWLGVSLKTSHLYAKNGPSGPAAKAIQGRLKFGHW